VIPDGSSALNLESEHFLDNANKALLQDEQVRRRDHLGVAIADAREAAVGELENFEDLRQHMRQVRQHTLDNLDHYLLKFEQQAVRNGSQVHFARTGKEMNSLVLDICQQHSARRVAKGKSMVTEETELNAYLLSAGLNVVETDLGEYIIQLAGERPSHILGPALHKSPKEIGQLFLEKHDLGPRELEEPADMVAEARTILRQHFLEAEVGIIGSNALIAENGYSMLVTNEGNGDLCANLPKVLIVCTTLDRVLPRAADASTMLPLLVRSAIGKPVTSYTSFYSGPRHGDDPDGPLEMHFILLDNKRSAILASDYQEMLHCIRCGSCLTHCPVYIGAGGHAYGSVYSGPMGSVLTPLLNSLEESNVLPNACTACGRCAEICPADIPLPDLLRDLRHEETQHKLSSGRWRRGIKAHAWLSAHPALYHWLTSLTISLMRRLGRKRGSFQKLPLAGGWTASRDFPAPQAQTFMKQYRARQATDHD
jgi:L-lactate dehydrogenase complex protein LldF